MIEPETMWQGRKVSKSTDNFGRGSDFTAGLAPSQLARYY
jgi:hypothetical protein